MDDLKNTAAQSDDDAQLLTAQSPYPAQRPDTHSDTLDNAETAIPYQLLLAHINVGVVVVQREMICYINPIVLRLTGYDRQALLAQPFSRLIYPDDLPRVLEYQQRRIADETEPVTATFRLARKGGKAAWVEATLCKVRWGKQSIHLYTITAISEQKHADASLHASELAKANERLAVTNFALEAERAYFSSAIDLLPVPLCLVSSSHRLVRMNKAFLQFLKQQDFRISHQLTLYDPESHRPLPPEEYPEYRALNGEVVPYFEALLKTPREVEIPVIEHAAPIIIGGQIAAVVVAFQDITALKEIDRAKNEFLAVLSHELVTPLTSILGWTEIAQEATSPESLRHALEVVARNARRQQRILDDLLDVSRIIHQKLLIRQEVTDLWRLSMQCIESIQQKAKDRRITVDCFPPDQPLPIYADSGRIIQVISNLLNNALKFTDPGGQITVAGVRCNTSAKLAVHDTGCGIHADAICEIFKPFLQIQRNEANGGLGLGLALTKGIIELHNGQIAVYSPGEGQGSTFTIELPLLREEG